MNTDGSHSIFHHWKWRAKRSCDATSKQHGDVMPSSCHSEKMLWNPSILHVYQNSIDTEQEGKPHLRIIGLICEVRLIKEV